MPGDLKIVLTIVAGLCAIGAFIFWAATRPVDDDESDPYLRGFDEAPENPEDRVRRHQS